MPALNPNDITSCVVRALFLYALAEAQSGHAGTIRIETEGTSFSITDDGRGHAIDRTVDGSPYLQFVYTHLDYPFESGRAQAVQLHVIGLSLINAMCSELTVIARKRDVTLRMSFRSAHLFDSERLEVDSQETGNTISGTLGPHIQTTSVDTTTLQQWLQSILAALPSLKLYFNGVALHAHSSDAA